MCFENYFDGESGRCVSLPEWAASKSVGDMHSARQARPAGQYTRRRKQIERSLSISASEKDSGGEKVPVAFWKKYIFVGRQSTMQPGRTKIYIDRSRDFVRRRTRFGAPHLCILLELIGKRYKWTQKILNSVNPLFDF